jgi:hypothetical protein
MSYYASGVISMRKFPETGLPGDAIQAEGLVFVGIDIAVNREKGLRCVVKTSDGQLWETTLRLRRPIQLLLHYPFVNLPLPDHHEISAQFLSNVFMLDDEQAISLAQIFNLALYTAIDSPPMLANGNRRVSETIWHNHIIPGIKDRVGGIYWTPNQLEIAEILYAFFNEPQTLTTEQITKLSQTLWMFVGFWLHTVFRNVGRDTIEVYPASLRQVCQDITNSPFSNELHQDFANWNTTLDFDDFINRKSETNDAAISCFTAYLVHLGRSEQLHPDEIVVPLHQGRPFNIQGNQ